MIYEVAGSLFKTQRQAHRALAQEWLSAGGLNDVDDIGKLLRT